jgi:nitroimidazol reductase NimA-like FMN-containing flavoprotein (pyridoxamine 5'-phosphate oxidase superfamily)
VSTAAPTDVRVRTWLIGISTDECACAHLLSASGLGRLAVIVNGRPQIFPVNHVYDRPSGCVVFPTRAGTKLHGALDWPWVAFEVDGLDRDGGGGWSVLVAGRAEEVTDPELIARAATAREALWGAGRGTHWVRIVPSEVSGRRISAVVG